MASELIHNITSEINITSNPFDKVVLTCLKSIVTDTQKYNTTNSPIIQNALMVKLSNSFAELYNLLKLTDQDELQKRAHELWYAVDTQIAMRAH